MPSSRKLVKQTSITRMAMATCRFVLFIQRYIRIYVRSSIIKEIYAFYFTTTTTSKSQPSDQRRHISKDKDNISYYKITLTKNIVALQSFKH